MNALAELDVLEFAALAAFQSAKSAADVEACAD